MQPYFRGNTASIIVLYREDMATAVLYFCGKIFLLTNKRWHISYFNCLDMVYNQVAVLNYMLKYIYVQILLTTCSVGGAPLIFEAAVKEYYWLSGLWISLFWILHQRGAMAVRTGLARWRGVRFLNLATPKHKEAFNRCSVGGSPKARK